MRKVYRPFSPNLHHLLYNPDEQLPGGRLAGRLPPLLLLPLRHRRPLPHLPSTLTHAHRHPSLAHDAGVPSDVFFCVWVSLDPIILPELSFLLQKH